MEDFILFFVFREFFGVAAELNLKHTSAEYAFWGSGFASSSF